MPKCNFNKVAKHRCSLPSATFLKETLAQVFSCEFYEISKNIVFTELLRETAFIFSSAMLFSSVDKYRQMCKE